MTYRRGDLLEGDWDVAMHCANPHQVMGSGIAYHLKKKWPEVYQADLDYDIDPEEKLGTFSYAILADYRTVINLYGQVGVGNNGTPIGRNCRYDHLYNAIYSACEAITRFTDETINVGVPARMASDRAGGSWKIVTAILEDIEEKFDVEFVIYELGEDTGVKLQSSVFIDQL